MCISCVQFKAHPFDLKQITLLDGPMKTAMELDAKYLRDLDVDRLLYSFRVNAGLPAPGEPYGGWEAPDCELRGHFVGHYLTACALMYSANGDDELKARGDALVAGLAECQAALPSQGCNRGYISAYPESFIDRWEECKPVWAPYYTLHKIFAGLIDMYLHCGNEQALDVAKTFAGWVKFRTDKLTEKQMQDALEMEFGGMAESFANLYAITNDPDHLTLARRFDKHVFFGPLSQGVDKMRGIHSNTHIPMVVGAAREYEVSGEASYRDISEFFWNQVANHRSFATGGTSSFEHWRNHPGEMASEINVESQECCCTYNMLKLTKQLFTWSPKPEYADYYERALYNGIVGTQHPENGMMMYYVPMKPGHWKIFNTPYDAFWCCTGTGVENHAKYGEAIYFRDNSGLYVNLFIASELDWAEKGLKVRQETSFSDSDITALTISAKEPVQMALRVRIPYWATNGVTIKLNGQNLQAEAAPSSYYTIDRTWQDCDKLELTLPMSLHLAPMPDNPNLVAVMYGPLVLAGEMGTESFTKDMQFVPNQRQQHSAASIEEPCLVLGDKAIDEWLKPVEGKPFTWRTQGVGRPTDFTLVPWNRLFDQRYNVYWYLRTDEQQKAIIEERKSIAERMAAEMEDAKARTIDTVRCGWDEYEQAHNLQSEASNSGWMYRECWREATLGGWFSYDLKSDPNAPVSVRCRYWGMDSGRIFDILVDGEKIAQETLVGDKGGMLYEIEYPIPFELTRGKDKITVRFQAHPGNIAGGVFAVSVLKGSKQ